MNMLKMMFVSILHRYVCMALQNFRLQHVDVQR